MRKQVVAELDAAATGGLRPDLTLLFDLEERLGLVRATGAGRKLDRMEMAGAAFHYRVRQEFQKLAKEDTVRIKMIKVAGKSKEAITEEAMKHLERFL
jgi:dTMP kinase